MNNSTIDRLNDFYNSFSAHLFATYTGCITLFIMLSNAFFIGFTLTSQNLRSTIANWFLVGLAISDLLHGAAHHAGAWAIFTGSINNRSFCALAGFFIMTTATCSYGFPAIIAADRYYKITAKSNTSRWSCVNSIFSDKMVVPLIVSWFAFSFLLNLPLFLNNAFGEDLQLGLCCAKPFTSVTMLSYYEVSMMATFSGALFIAAIYYHLLAKYLNTNYVSDISTAAKRESVNYTKALMRVMKIILIVPLVTTCPAAILSAGQMLLPELPVWVGRVFMTPYFWSSCANPWLSIFLIRPFRVRFLVLFRVCTARVDPNNNKNISGTIVSVRTRTR